MNLEIDDKINFNFQETVIKQIVSEDDKATRECIYEYVKNNYKDENVRLDFLSKERIDLIIDLGMKALIRRENRSFNRLKIIDDIELSELENYEFEEGKNTYDFWDGVRKIIIYKSDRRISFNGFNSKAQFKLFDLIEAGLVEKG